MLDLDVQVHRDGGLIDLSALVGALKDAGLARLHRVHLLYSGSRFGQISDRYFFLPVRQDRHGGDECNIGVLEHIGYFCSSDFFIFFDDP